MFSRRTFWSQGCGHWTQVHERPGHYKHGWRTEDHCWGSHTLCKKCQNLQRQAKRTQDGQGSGQSQKRILRKDLVAKQNKVTAKSYGCFARDTFQRRLARVCQTSERASFAKEKAAGQGDWSSRQWLSLTRRWRASAFCSISCKET